MSSRVATVIEVAGRELTLTNVDKVLYPACGFTKGQVIDYYLRASSVLLPHLADRALTQVRFPEGVSQPGFFEKNRPRGTPEWVRVRRLPAPGSGKNRDVIDYVIVDGVATLAWLANLAALELHTPQWRVDAVGPDRLVVDLDPGAPAGIRECCQVALVLRERLAVDGLRAYPKTSGKKGLQLYCPISAEQPAAEINRYAHRIAQELERQWPGEIVSRMEKRLRVGKVFIDWSQNNAAKTTVAPYSLRATASPRVSTPLTWREVRDGCLDPGLFTASAVLERITTSGDPLAAVCQAGPRVPETG